MWSKWTSNNNSADKYDAELAFPEAEARVILNRVCTSWPSYNIQISFVDSKLNVLSHLDLPTGFNLQESQLPKELKALFRHWSQKHEDYDLEDTDEDAYQLFSWIDNIISSSMQQNHSLPRRNIGTLYPNQNGGSGSGPRFPEVYIFGEVHLR
jgi:hypothetical protein